MELKTLADIRPLERHRVEDVDKYSDAELGALLKGIFGLADIPGTIKKLKAKELYLLADGVAKKPLANLPVLAPVEAAAAAGGRTGAATGAVAAPKEDGNAGLTDKEIIDLNRRLDEAEKNGPERFGEEEVEMEPMVAMPALTPKPTANDVGLARSPGQTNEQRAAREKVARDFYHEHPTLGDDRCDEDILGVDLNQPVEVVEFPPPPEMGQFVRKGSTKTGNFFDPVGGQSADSMGLNGDPSTREYRTYTSPKGQGLKSTAAPITDTWTDSNNPVKTSGGGQQIVVDNPTSAMFNRV